MGSATPTQLIDNDRVRVTEWKFQPGESTGYHRHEFDYVVVPTTTGDLLLKEPDGDRVVRIETGVPYFRNEGVEHDVINPSKENEIIFVEVEIK
ncbi:MAG: cupin [Gammaproteobacteria bacterium]|jgi:quercetin dioxygenase-like cupin family protein|nr:cupin [Gammaproteobacteria bacterium]